MTEDIMTNEELYGPAMNASTKAEVDAHLERIVSVLRDGLPDYSDEALRRMARWNVAYYAGYFDDTTRERVRRLFACAQPFASIIREVQDKIGVVPDGIWGPRTLHALKKTGKTLTEMLEECFVPVTGPINTVPSGGPRTLALGAAPTRKPRKVRKFDDD